VNPTTIHADEMRQAPAPAGAERPSLLSTWRAQREAERAGPRNEVIASSDPRVLELFGVGHSAAGVYVTPSTAMRVAAVYACVRLIAGAVATLPLHLYERTSDGRQRVEDAPLWWLLNEQPSTRYSAASHWEHVIATLLLRGDPCTFIRRGPMGDVKELVPLPWDAVRIERHTNDEGTVDRLKYYVQDVRTFGVDQDDMLHFPGFGFNGERSMSVIQWAARNAAGNALAMDEYSGRFFAGGAHPSIVLEAPNKMGKELVADLQQAFAAKYSGLDNAHKLPLVLTEGIKANALTVNAEDAQLLDARKFQVVDIARAFGVPPHMIGETSASTSWGSGIESMGRAFVTYTLQPHLVRIEQELNRKLFRTARRFVEFNRDALLEGDSKAQADYFKAALGGPGSGPGWMSPDDVRKIKNMPPKGGKYGEIFYPDPKAKAPKQEKDSDHEDPEAPAAAA
jgi:HK97 family phage portal protein